MSDSKPQRRRGRILTEEGWRKLEVAVRREYPYDGIEPDFGQIALKVAVDKGLVSSDTVAKIWKRKKGADLKYIKAIGRTFGLSFQEKVDYIFAADAPKNKPTLSPSDRPTERELDDGRTRWVGREGLIADLVEKLRGECRVLSVVGLTGIGKTSLAGQLAKNSSLKEFLPGLKTLSFYQELSPSFGAVARLVLGDELLKSQPQLVAKENEELLLQTMVEVLQRHGFLLIIDMVEAVLEPDGKGGHKFMEPVFAKFLDRVVLAEAMRTRVILTSQDRPPVMAQGRFPDRNCTQPLGGLSQEEAMELFRQWDLDLEAEGNESYLQRIVAIYEGHPLALRVIAGEIRSNPYDGSVAAYWGNYGADFEEVERLKTATEGDPGKDRLDLTPSDDLQELVARRIDASFQRLREGYPLACQLLCMGAASMRNAWPREAWLNLIGEYPYEEQKLAWLVLQRRLFLEVERSNNKILYRLHGLMRQVGLKNLAELEKGEHLNFG